ncbi:MAG TPA: hypothetical protein VGB24_05350 [Longimicrobium sp.]|uniref:hypothetical protein n=1 Tax=Longimicrobium sp. TaxID=2029185 RepID=UPI002EDABAA0
MSEIKSLFFAADPHSAPSYGKAPRLMVDEDVRRIREKVRAAEHRSPVRAQSATAGGTPHAAC